MIDRPLYHLKASAGRQLPSLKRTRMNGFRTGRNGPGGGEPSGCCHGCSAGIVARPGSGRYGALTRPR